MGGNNNKSGRFAKQYGPLKKGKQLRPWTENTLNVKQIPLNGITNLKHLYNQQFLYRAIYFYINNFDGALLNYRLQTSGFY